MPESITVDSSKAVFVTAEPDDQKKIINSAGSTLYYSTESTVSSSSNDGNLTAGQSLTIEAGRWIVCGAGGTARVNVLEASADSTVEDLSVADDVTVGDDLTVADDATVTGDLTVTADAILPTGSIGAGELATGSVEAAEIATGALTAADAAADLATQAELDAHINEVTTAHGLTVAQVALRNAANTFSVGQTMSHADGLVLSADGGKDTLSLSNTTANVGVTVGADTNWYRPSANLWKTDDGVEIALTLLVTGTSIFTGAQTMTGASTLTGGVVGGLPANVYTWQAVAATSGTDRACTDGTAYVGSVFLPMNATITGVQYLIGSVGGTNNVIASLHSKTGTLLANSDLAGALVGTAANLQQVAFTGTYAAVGPAYYFLALTFNGNTAKFRTIPAHTQNGVLGGSVAQTFGTSATFTAPTTFTADLVPVASLY